MIEGQQEVQKMVVQYSKSDLYAVADANVDAWYNEHKEALHVYVTSGIQLDRLRVGHLKGEIYIENIVFEDQYISINKDGKLSEWPLGMFDERDLLLDLLIGYCYRGDSL